MHHWHNPLQSTAIKWCDLMRKRVGCGNEYSEWWLFIHLWSTSLLSWINDFKQGTHVFSPIKQITFTDEIVQVWSYLDRLILHLIWSMLERTIKHVISPRCLHLKGPSVIKKATREINSALSTERFHYFLRMDIKSYYASINHAILSKQVHRHYASGNRITLL